jgi:hypothetical protein
MHRQEPLARRSSGDRRRGRWEALALELTSA